MKFTIVTPSYNQAVFLENTINSVLCQTYEDYEYIIVDGGSTDSSAEIIRRYEPRLAKAIIEHDEGQADAVNKGLLDARGDIYSYLNSDDYYFEDTLSNVAKVFHENPDVDVIYGDCVYTDESGQFLQYFSGVSDYDKRKLLNNNDFIMQPACFWRKSVFDKFGPFDKHYHYGFDWAFWCELAQHDCKFLRIDEVLAANRVYSSTKTKSGSDERLRELKKINDKYKTTLLSHAYYGFSREEYSTKTEKSIYDYFLVLFYLLMSYQNVINYFRNYNKKVINGCLPKSKLLLKESRIKLPGHNYSKLHLALSSCAEPGQIVSIYRHDEFLGRFPFERGVLELDIERGERFLDFDIQFQFHCEYDMSNHFIERLFNFYKPSKISAVLVEFTLS